MFYYSYPYFYPQLFSKTVYDPYNQVIGQPDYFPVSYYSVTNMLNLNGARQYPAVDPTLFNKSAISMQRLMKEASLVLNKLAESKDFAYKVMAAAQKSNFKEVERLIKTTGIKSKVVTTYTPDGIILKLSSKVGISDCCYLTISLRWR